MIWFFTRENAHVDLEVHRLPQGSGYVFAVTQADGSERVEKFSDPARLVTRVLSVQQRLLEEGWMPTSPTGAKPAVRPRPRRRRPVYARVVRRAVTRVQRSITRLAGVFGL
jgi:hypothetical protein